MHPVSGSHPAQTINNPSVSADQKDIGRTAHKLHNQFLVNLIAQLVIAAQLQNQQPVIPRLLNFFNPRAHQMFPHEHAEHGRLLGLLIALLRNLHPSRSRARRQQKTEISVPAPERQQQLVSLRLQLFGQLVGQCRQKNRI